MLSVETRRGNRETIREGSYGRFLYNFYRTYDPNTGRYLEADPVGQFGVLKWRNVATSVLGKAALQELGFRPASTAGRAEAATRRIGDELGLNQAQSGAGIPGLVSGRVGGPRVLGVTNSNLFTYGLDDPVNSIDPTGEWVAPALIVGGALAVGGSLWIYADVADACREYCDKQADAGECPPGETICYAECMTGANNIITSTYGSKISKGVGLLFKALAGSGHK